MNRQLSIMLIMKIFDKEIVNGIIDNKNQDEYIPNYNSYNNIWEKIFFPKLLGFFNGSYKLTFFILNSLFTPTLGFDFFLWKES